MLHRKNTMYMFIIFYRYEQKHHSQVVVCLLHAAIATVGAFWSFLPYHTNTPVGLQSMTTFRMYEFLTVESCDWVPAMQTLQGLDLIARRQFFIELTLGYFVADTIVYFVHYGLFGVPFLDIAHHIVSIYGFAQGLQTGISTFALTVLLSNEISTVLLHCRFFLQQWDQKTSLVYGLLQLVFAITFFLSRIVWNTFLMLATLRGVFFETTPYANTYVKYSQCTLLVLFVLIQYAWFAKIVQIAMAKSKGKAE